MGSVGVMMRYYYCLDCGLRYKLYPPDGRPIRHHYCIHCGNTLFDEETDEPT